MFNLKRQGILTPTFQYKSLNFLIMKCDLFFFNRNIHCLNISLIPATKNATFFFADKKSVICFKDISY